jgi:lysophospholipase L1-like esterase
MRSLIFVFIALFCCFSALAQAPYTREKMWEKDINEFAEIDKKQSPPRDAIVFTGSSSIRMWSSLRTDFPHLNVMNRGFGGSQMEDLVHFASKLVLPYKPSKIVVYSGENDIDAGQTAENVLADLKDFIAFRDKDLKNVPVLYISMKPSVLRWAKWPEMKKGNDLIKTEAAKHKRVTFVDIAPGMLGADGKPRPELFLGDGLHMNAKGYEVWRAVLLPYLK